ncbi:alanine aminotransferase [Euryarchaeota archaeon ex4484_178]|nr:MAG: alanine aminotransferase [Euryarchaeota archaeon ex4484_178]
MIPASIRAMRIEYAIRDVVVPARELEKKGIEVLKLNIGDPIKYDFKTPEHIREAAAKAVMESRSEYSPSEGLLELREAIVEKEKGYGVDITTDDVVVTTGVTEALMLIFAAALDPGQEILVPGPTYPPYITYPIFYDGKAISYRTVEENGWQPDPDDIRKKINKKTKAIAVINPNNPTGAYYDEKTIREIADIAAEHNVFMISDEIYDKMLYDHDFTSPARIAQDVPMIILNGISKVYLAPGWRIGYLAIRDVDNKLSQIREGIMKQARARLCANSGFCPIYGRGHFRIVNLPPIEYLERAFDRIEEFMKN